MTNQLGKPGSVAFAEDEDSESSPAARLKDDPRWQLVTRIVASPGFSKSPKLVGFLRFVAQRSLTDPSSQINEQSIGVTVFGRTSGYDSNDDNIVRSHASRLRQKLDAYFQNEGAGEMLRVAIPKGSYAPAFSDAPLAGRPEPAATQPAAEIASERGETKQPLSPAEPETQPAVSVQIPRRYWLMLLAACLVCIAATYFVTANLHRKVTSGMPEGNHALWQELLAGKQNTLIVNGDSSLVIYENMTGKVLSIEEYISGNYRDETPPQTRTDPHTLRTIARRRLTSIVDLNIANHILGRQENLPGHVSLRYARDLHVDDLKGANAIFIGSQEANPWIQLYSDSLNFSIVPDQQTKVFTIRNRSPKPGEAAEYQSVPGDPERRAYATVTFLKNLGGTGHVLMIQGTGMAGTEAAADYVLAQDELTSLLSKARPIGGPLPEFEILLETSNLNGNAPKSKLVAFRINGR